jgi:uncharacterized membrane protein
LNLLGILALVVGLLVTVPITWLTIAHVYRTLSAQTIHVAPRAALAA